MDILIQWVQALIEWVKCIPTSIYCAITAFANYLLDLLKYIGLQLYALFVEAAVAFFGIIPVPDFFADAQGYLNQVAASVGYFFGLVQFNSGLLIVTTAYLLKFAIRRIPGVG